LLPSNSHIPGSISPLFHASKPSNTCAFCLPGQSLSGIGTARDCGLPINRDKGWPGKQVNKDPGVRIGTRAGQANNSTRTPECESGQGLRQQLSSGPRSASPDDVISVPMT
jgi:hypothetical protein